MSFNTDDTICAIATPAGSAGRGIVRVSGPCTIEIVERCFRPADSHSLTSTLRATTISGLAQTEFDSRLRDLGCDLFLWPNDSSYTREPVAEFHVFGSATALESLANTLCRLGARPAARGEFTLRAFLAGRLDLTQAEAVLGVIDARGSQDLDAALVQLAGGLSRPLDRLRDELLQLLAELEAGLDFVEEDIEFISSAVLHERLQRAVELLDDVSQQMRSRHLANELPQIALVGAPNAGKSSLFNALVERYGRDHRSLDRQPNALVSSKRGTTRDYLISPIWLDELQCCLVDTAGVAPPSDLDRELVRSEESLAAAIDNSAQIFAVEQKEKSTIRAYCVDAREAVDAYRLRELQAELKLGCRDILFLTKADLLPTIAGDALCTIDSSVLLISSRDGSGLEEVRKLLGSLVAHNSSAEHGSIVAATAGRCRESVRSAETSLKRAAAIVKTNGGNELVAVEVRAALDEIGTVVGAVYTDDLLDRIFGTFCIGK